MVGYHSGSRSNWSMAIPKGSLSSYNWPYKIINLHQIEKKSWCVFQFNAPTTVGQSPNANNDSMQWELKKEKKKSSQFICFRSLSTVQFSPFVLFVTLITKFPLFFLPFFCVHHKLRKMLFSPSQKSLHHNETERGNITKLEKECLRVMTDESSLSPEGISSVTYILLFPCN